MKKLNTLVLSSLTAAFLIGCGGGSSTASTTASSVTVERGALIGATVTDTNGQVATATTASSNVYTFATTPKYPISATGGVIDIDGNGIDEGDVAFTGTLTSYSEVITPITTLIGDPTSDAGKAMIASLKEKSGITDDADLLDKVPSAVSAEVLILTNAIFEALQANFDNDSTNDIDLSDETTLATALTNLEGYITTYNTVKTQSGEGLELTALAKLLEEESVSNIGLHTYTEQEATDKKTETEDLYDLSTGLEYEEWPIQGPTTYSAMKTAFLDATNPNYFGYNNTTYIFNSDNTICEKDSDGTDGVRADYSTCSSSIGTWTELNETMIATMSDGGKVFEKIINGNVWTAYSGGAESDSSDSSTSTTSENSDASKYLSASFSDPLGLAGKEITFSTTDHQNYYTFTFNNDGTLSGYINLDPECTGKYNNMYNDTMVGYVLTCGSYTSELALQSVTDSAYAELFTTFGDDSTMEELSIVEIVQ